MSNLKGLGGNHGVMIKICRRHLSIFDTGNCEVPFRFDCQPLFVLAGCLLLLYSSLLREEHSPAPALQPFFVLTCVLPFFLWIPVLYLYWQVHSHNTTRESMPSQWNRKKLMQIFPTRMGNVTA